MAEPIHCLVFSKDRAMQLDAFLRSAKRHAPYASITALIHPRRDSTNTDPSYGQCAYEHPHVRWRDDDVPHRTFEQGAREFVDAHERVVFHTDDEVFYRTPPAGLFDNADDVVTLRQGRNTSWCQVLSCEQQIPAGFPRWRWRDAEHDFAYPLSLNATVYRSGWIRPLLNFPFVNPTRLEAGLACQHASFQPEYMVAPELSCTVALPHNVVSVDSNCPRGGNPDWQPGPLNERYLDGWRIDLDSMDFGDIVAAHQEVPLMFARREGA